MAETLVSRRTEDGIMVLEMNDPPANTYSYEMMQQLDAAILEARMDDAIHVPDLRVARRDGGKIGLPEVTLGVLPGTGGTQRLARLVGPARAIELLATGRTFPFAEAAALGLVTHVFEPENWWDRVMAYARQFCPPGKAAKAVGLIKRSVVSGAGIPFLEGLALERELQQQLFESADAREGLNAYIEKRAPSFKGA